MSNAKIELANLSIESHELKIKQSYISAKVQKVQAELAQIKNRIRGSNSHTTRLSPDEYRQLCNRQTKLIKKQEELFEEGAPIRTRLREIGAMSTLYYAEQNENAPNPELENYKQLDGLRSALISTRKKWLEFSEDNTRVNSMRLMAAQFSRELTDILASCNIKGDE